MSRRAWTVVVTGAAMVFLTMGTRQSIGLFLKPVTDTLDADRESYSLSVAAHNLILGLPLAAMAADRFGPRRIVAVAGFLMGTGLLVASRATSMWVFGSSLAVVFGLAVSGAAFVVVFGAVGKAVPQHRQSSAFGIVTAGASIGMFALVPVVQILIDGLGWRGAMATLGVSAFVFIGGASRLLPADEAGRLDAGRANESMTAAVTHAFRDRSYVLLTAGFFVCGFHVAFIASHLPAYLTDEGLSDRTAALALSLIGLCNIAGSLTAGWLGDRLPRRTLLALLYLGRAIVMTAFLVVPVSTGSALVFGAAMGLLWLSTVPLTSGLVAALFGPRYLSTLFGIVFFSHQVGAFLGVWLAGRWYDSSGSYQAVWVVAVVLAVAAALVHIPIARRPETAAPVGATATT